MTLPSNTTLEANTLCHPLILVGNEIPRFHKFWLRKYLILKIPTFCTWCIRQCVTTSDIPGKPPVNNFQIIVKSPSNTHPFRIKTPFLLGKSLWYPHERTLLRKVPIVKSPLNHYNSWLIGSPNIGYKYNHQSTVIY